MMEIVATSDLIRPKPTYDPRIITSRFSPRHNSPSLERTSPYNQYPKSATSPLFHQTSPRQLTSLVSQVSNHVKLPAVSIPFVTHHGLMYTTNSPKGIMLPGSEARNSPPGSSPSTTPTTPLPTTPATPSFLQQPTPTRPTPKKIYTCKLCGKTFNNSGNFSRHQKVHTGEKPYRCEICGKAFTQSSTLKRHILSHSGDRSYKCQVCSKGYVDPWSLKKHMKNHGFNTYSHVQVKPILPNYKFHPPNVVVPQKPHLAHPWTSKPEITPPGMYLPLGSEQPSPTVPHFKSGGSAFTQVESKLSKDDKKEGEDLRGEARLKSEALSSSDALAALYMLDTLKQNMKHNQDKKDSETKENDNIMQFTSGHKTLPEKENEFYTCDKCGRSFNNVNNYKTHQVIHAGSLACNGELACHQCKAVFVTKQQLQSHMTTHTSSYWCVYCERSFRNEYNFKQHQTVHTTLVQDGDKKYPTWLESFRQEMMTCVTSLEAPHLPMPSLNTPAVTTREHDEDVDVGPDSRRDDAKALKLKAMMDIDPLGHAVVHKFCPPSSAPFYSAAGSNYSAASLSAGSSRSSVEFAHLHDPLARHHPQSAGIHGSSNGTSFPSIPHSAGGALHSSGTFAHPKPLKFDSNSIARRLSFEESTHALKSIKTEQQQRQLHPEERQREQQDSHDKEEKPSTAMMQTSPSEDKKEKSEENRSEEEQDKKTKKELTPQQIKQEQMTTGEVERSSEDGPVSKKPRNITYQCCMCESNTTQLSDLTLHLENKHDLIDYELIKVLLACLGDIGA